MRVRNTILWAAGIIAALGVGFVTGTAQERSAPRIVAVYGVGGVLSDDGILWQYMPEERQWMTIDEAFERGGQFAGNGKSAVLPLPVPVDEIMHIESWGFLVTKSGVAWHYDLRSNRWENVGTP